MLNFVGDELHLSASHTVRQRAVPRSALAEVLKPEDVLLGLEAANASQALSGIARFVASRHGLSDALVQEGLAEREQIGSTSLGCGVAIPHARLKGLAHPVAAFVRMAMPVPFDAPDGKPVTELLVLLVPWEATEEHLVMLSEIAAMFSDRDFREELRNCSDREGLCAKLTGRHEAG